MKTSLKIAIIRQHYTPFGGAERFVARALDALTAQGAEIDIIARRWPQSNPENSNSRNAYHFIECNPRAWNRRGRDRGFAQAAIRLAQSKTYDIVQSHERIPGTQIFRAGDGVHAAWLNHLAQARGPLSRIVARLDPYHRYVLAAEKAMFEHPALQAVICNSSLVRDEIAAHYVIDPKKLRLIRNGIDLDRFNPKLADEHRTAVRHTYRIPLDAPLILYVGSGFERKGVPRLLHALARLPQKNSHLAIVGADKKTAAMRSLAERLNIADRVHFAGPQQQVEPWYGAADVFALPTLYDPLPNACLEAMASGLPTLTSTTCGAAELITPGKNGIVCAALAVEAIADGLQQLIENAAGMRDAARSSVEHLGLDTMGRQLFALYEEILQAREP